MTKQCHNTVINGDCPEIIKEIADESIDIVFCDLPYGTLIPAKMV